MDAMNPGRARSSTTANPRGSIKSDPLIGVWFDMEESNIIALDGSAARVEKVTNDLEKHKEILTSRYGGTGSGRQFINRERSEQEKLDHELDQYITDVLKVLVLAPRMVVFGPAGTKKELIKRMKVNARWRRSELLVEPADKMTDKQKVAWLRAYAGHN